MRRGFGISDLALDAIGGKAKAAPSAVPGAVPPVLHGAMTHAIINPTSRFAVRLNGHGTLHFARILKTNEKRAERRYREMVPAGFLSETVKVTRHLAELTASKSAERKTHVGRAPTLLARVLIF
ncbi:hypothetical protein HZH68_007511 [Vespula germanica]|uniref:Uncharacterized protein n=1 Tax=Vespula germanica TaxID=30212 RepID=A0A834K7S6_VESGE|nr:hypothetical protein HZH68_007511 [Vespula germanica]